MNFDREIILITFLIATFITLLSRFKRLIDNPTEVVRHEDGRINWIYNVFVNTVELLIGGVVGVGVGVVLEYYHLLEGNMLMLAVALSGLGAGKIFEAAQRRIHKKVDDVADSDFSF